MQCRTRARSRLVPDLAPHFGGGHAQRLGMLAANDVLVGVIVEIDHLLAPPDEHRLARGQHDPHAGLEAAGPGGGRTELCLAPVMPPDTAPHLSSTLEKSQIRILWRRDERRDVFRQTHDRRKILCPWPCWQTAAS